jgi:hypothetical protein
MKVCLLASITLLFASASMASQCTLTTTASVEGDGDVVSYILTTRVFQLDGQGNGSFHASFSENGAGTVETSGPAAEMLNSTLASSSDGAIKISVVGSNVSVVNNGVSASNAGLLPIVLENYTDAFGPDASGLIVGYQATLLLHFSCGS